MTPRQRAKEAGLKFYRTGKPCPKGHRSKRWTSTTKCVACHEMGRKARRKLQRDWYVRNEAGHNTRSRDNHRKLREDVIDGYGGQCECCGEKAIEFLCLDHTNGGGNRHRKYESNVVLFNRLRCEGFPKGQYRVLCHNCNFSIGLYGYCPHQRKLQCD